MNNITEVDQERSDMIDREDDELSLSQLFLALLCPIIVIIFSYFLRLELISKIVVSVSRTIIQLYIAGYLLLGFIFATKSAVVVSSYLCLMLLIAALEVVSRVAKTYRGHFFDGLLCVSFGGLVIGGAYSMIVFQSVPSWNPQIVIPIIGMIMNTCISSPTLAVERLLSSVTEKKHEQETRLAFGANSYEASVKTFRIAMFTALTPTMNMMNVIGIVAIPGSLSGGLLAGEPPLLAAEYQICILYMLFTSAFVSSSLGLHLALRHAVFDENHRLTTNRIIEHKQKDIDQALYNVIKDVCVHAFLPSHTLSFGSNSTSRPYQMVKSTSSDRLTVELESAYDQESGMEMSPNGSLKKEPPSGRVSYRIEVMNSYEEQILQSGCTDGADYENKRIRLPLLQLSSLNVTSNKDLLFVDSGLDLTLYSGERVAIEGPSGIGKSRLLKAISQLDSPHSGCMQFLTGVLSGDGWENPSWRRQCVYIPQAFPAMEGTPKELLLECCQYASRLNQISSISLQSNIDSFCSNLEESLGLSSGKLSEQWKDLSGGERQRAAIGCGLALTSLDPTLCHSGRMSNSDPKSQSKKVSGNTTYDQSLIVGQLCDCQTDSQCVLLLDEPTAACDSRSCALVESAIRKSGVTVLFITHDTRFMSNTT